jgi:hypothetical protein
MVTVDIFYAVCYAALIAGAIGWYIEHVKENAAQLHYWRGRKDGSFTALGRYYG